MMIFGFFFFSFQATETFLVNEDPSRGPGMPECFVVSDSYRVCLIITIFPVTEILIIPIVVIIDLLFVSAVITVTDSALLYSC